MITIRIWQEQGKSCESRPAAVLFGSAARGRASRRGVKHNLLRSLSPPEGGPAKRSRSGLSPVSSGPQHPLATHRPRLRRGARRRGMWVPRLLKLRINPVQKRTRFMGAAAITPAAPSAAPRSRRLSSKIPPAAKRTVLTSHCIASL